jgi:hypothetical protein
MKLDQHERLTKIITDKMQGKYRCPICIDTKHSFLVGTLIEMREYNEGYAFGGATIVPFVPITCSTCSHTILLSAMHLGILDSRGKYRV